jgi:hypothetical protein
MRTSNLLGLGGGLGVLALKELSKKRAKPTISEGMQAGRMPARRRMSDRGRMPDMIGERNMSSPRMKKGGAVKSKPKSSASKRADGCAKKGKTRGKMI